MDRLALPPARVTLAPAPVVSVPPLWVITANPALAPVAVTLALICTE